jgi:hypothetical protein
MGTAEPTLRLLAQFAGFVAGSASAARQAETELASGHRL